MIETVEKPESAANPQSVSVTETVILYELVVTPCKISQVTATVTIDPIDYYLGDPGFTFGDILFDNDSLCD